MTIDQITKVVSEAAQKLLGKKKPVSKRQVIRYMRSCKIKPLGTIRTKPRNYPEDSGARICLAIGATPTVTMNQLRDTRRRALAVKTKLSISRR